MELTVAELFAGVGGFRVGLNNIKSFDSNNRAIESGSWTFVWANQFEPSTKTQHAFNCYITRFGEENNSNIDINKVNDLSGFPKKIPSFAKQVDIHLKPPKAIEDGRYIQVSFTGKPSELKPYIQDAESHAKVIITKGEAERVFFKPKPVKLEPDSKKLSIFKLSKIFSISSILYPMEYNVPTKAPILVPAI